MRTIIALFVFLLSAGSLLAQATWNIDKSHSRVGFVVTHMVVAEVEGQFNDFDATVTGGGEGFNGADISFTAKTASINTDNERRDNDLRSDHFFDAEKFAEIKFNGKVVKTGDKYQLKGDLTIRDVTKPVTFDLTYGGSITTSRGTKAGFKISGVINRFDYGLTWDAAIESGGLVVSKDVTINCRIELNKAA